MIAFLLQKASKHPSAPPKNARTTLSVSSCAINLPRLAPKAARTAIGNQDMSIEAAVVGIVDRVDISDTGSDEMREAAHRLAQENGRP